MIINKKNEILGFSSNPKTIKKIAINVTTLLQDYKRGDFIVALAVLWLMICERFEVDPIRVMSFANRIKYETFGHKHDSQLRAIKDYMDNEL